MFACFFVCLFKSFTDFATNKGCVRRRLKLRCRLHGSRRQTIPAREATLCSAEQGRVLHRPVHHHHSYHTPHGALWCKTKLHLVWAAWPCCTDPTCSQPCAELPRGLASPAPTAALGSPSAAAAPGPLRRLRHSAGAVRGCLRLPLSRRRVSNPATSRPASRNTAGQPRDTSRPSRLTAGSFKKRVPPRPSSRDTAPSPVTRPWRSQPRPVRRGARGPFAPSPGTAPAPHLARGWGPGGRPGGGVGLAAVGPPVVGGNRR